MSPTDPSGLTGTPPATGHGDDEPHRGLSDDEPHRGHGPIERLILRADAWILDRWPESPRRRVGAIVAIVAIVVGTIAALRPLGELVHALDPLAYVSLAVTCWIGAGGALVPIPGVREVSWVMVVHQAAALEPLVVLPVAALAMALGQTSYYGAARAGARRERAAGKAADAPATPARRGGLRARVALLRRRAAAHVPAPIGKAMHDAKDAVTRMMHVHPRRAIFLVSIFPTPLTTFASATAGALGVGFRDFFVASLAGFAVLSLALVLVGRGILAALGIQAG